MIIPSRRDMLARLGSGMGMVGLAGVMHDAGHVQAATVTGDALAPKPSHFAPKAKHVIHLFMNGGPFQCDLFDPKPELTKHHGKPHPSTLEVHFHTQQGKLLASPFKFLKCGQSGAELSELLPAT